MKVLVTGTSAGIGRATAELFLERGHEVWGFDVQAATPALHYQSPLKAYQGFSEQPLHNWHEANELVGRIGGWRTYAQEPWESPPAEPAVEPSAKEQHHGHH